MNRRNVLKSSAAVMFGLAPAPGATTVPQLPERALLQSDPEAYWKRIRAEQFLLAEWRAFLNNGSLGVAPRPVLAAVIDYLNHGASLVSDDYPRWGYETLDAHRTEMAEFVGCKKDELAFMHNATEAMSTIAGGLDLKPGDEVLITDQEHPRGRGPWLQKAARFGITVREVPLPLPPKDPGQIADVIVSAIGPKTRVLSFSGITTTTGLVTPAKQICEAARAKGVITVVDGAHMTGQIPTKLSDIGCDFFAGSPHKWLFAPAGCGLLYVCEEMLDRLWANTVTGNWDDKKLKAARFMMVGTNNRAVFEGMMAGLRFHRAIGSEVVYNRIHQLARSVRQRVAASPHLECLTPDDDRQYGSLVAFKVRNGDYQKLLAACRKKRIWVLQADRIRISSNIHTRPSDIDLLLETVREVYG